MVHSVIGKNMNMFYAIELNKISQAIRTVSCFNILSISIVCVKSHVATSQKPAFVFLLVLSILCIYTGIGSAICRVSASRSGGIGFRAATCQSR